MFDDSCKITSVEMYAMGMTIVSDTFVNRGTFCDFPCASLE